MSGTKAFRIVALVLLAGVIGSANEPTPVPDAPKDRSNSIGMKLAPIPAGEFLMGTPDSDEDAQPFEKPRHRVRITQPFHLGVTEVTRGQSRVVTGKSPSRFKGSDDLPVESVSWEEAVAFCDKLNEREKGQLGGERCRLPTEADWEYACRAGSTKRFSFGDDEEGLREVGWFEGNSEGMTHPVRATRPIAFNLYDMHGNVWEWCRDWYGDHSYGRSNYADPSGPPIAEFRVDRGGGWGSSAQLCQSANRCRIKPGDRNERLGFRVARVRFGQ